MTESVFLDTNGWIALLNTSDDLHRSARAVWDRLALELTQIVVTRLGRRRDRQRPGPVCGP